jgi:hypothetical protein
MAKMCRLINAFGKVSAGGNGKKQFKNKYVQSQYVYENKQISDKMPEKSRTFMS